MLGNCFTVWIAFLQYAEYSSCMVRSLSSRASSGCLNTLMFCVNQVVHCSALESCSKLHKSNSPAHSGHSAFYSFCLSSTSGILHLTRTFCRWKLLAQCPLSYLLVHSPGLQTPLQCKFRRPFQVIFPLHHVRWWNIVVSRYCGGSQLSWSQRLDTVAVQLLR